VEAIFGVLTPRDQVTVNSRIETDGLNPLTGFQGPVRYQRKINGGKKFNAEVGILKYISLRKLTLNYLHVGDLPQS